MSCQLYGEDLKKLIDEKTSKGHQLLVCWDFNSDYKQLSNWMQQQSLVDIFATKHDKRPIIYQRLTVDPLDYIFESLSLKIKNGGYLAFGRLLSDHRGI